MTTTTTTTTTKAPKTSKAIKAAAQARIEMLASERVRAVRHLIDHVGGAHAERVIIIATGLADGTLKTARNADTGRVRVDGAPVLLAKVATAAESVTASPEAKADALATVSAATVSRIAQGLVTFYMDRVSAIATAADLVALADDVCKRWPTAGAIGKALGHKRTDTKVDPDPTAPKVNTAGRTKGTKGTAAPTKGTAAPTAPTKPTAPPTVDTLADALVRACEAHGLDLTEVLRTAARTGRTKGLTTAQVVVLADLD